VNSAHQSQQPTPEREVLLNAQKGDQQAFAQIVQSYQRPVYNLCYRMLGNAEEAEDAAQETFLRAYTNLNKFNIDRKFINWVLTIASNHCVDRLRKRHIHLTSLEAEPYAEKITMPESVNPHRRAERQEISDKIQEWLNELPPDYRTPIILHYWYGYSYEEISTIMSITVPAVKSRLHRARKRIAEMISQSQYPLTSPFITLDPAIPVN